MTLTITGRTGDPATLRSPMLAVALDASTRSVPAGLRSLDRLYGGQIATALRSRSFRGSKDETMIISQAGRRGPARLMLVGMGSASRRSGLRRAASIASRNAHKQGAGTLSFYAGSLDADDAEVVTIGLSLGPWEFADLKTQPPERDRRAPLAKAIVISSGDRVALRAGLAKGNAIADGYALTRRLAMMPPNYCTPDTLANAASDIGKTHGLKVTVLGRKEMSKLGMGAFLAVAQGTPQEPRLVTIEYRGAGARQAPIVLVGKGLCFDTGGISIKPADKMEMMKFDMSGAAAVLGAMKAIAAIKPEVNVVGLIGATTNMPSGEAYKPGDVVKASNGKSIEVINTDAEGRMVLADLLVYAGRFKPAAVVDAATLTGAVVIALGNVATGVMGRDQALIDRLLAAGRRADEPGWQLPLWDDYKDLIKSDVADVRNSGGRAAGTITAALFLAEFAESYPWAHLDVAGTAYSETDLVAIPRGPTGTPMGTFVEFVLSRAS